MTDDSTLAEHTMSVGMGLAMKAESDGLDTDEEVVTLANFYMLSRMHLSVGHAGRFMHDVLDAYEAGELDTEIPLIYSINR